MLGLLGLDCYVDFMHLSMFGTPTYIIFNIGFALDIAVSCDCVFRGLSIVVVLHTHIFLVSWCVVVRHIILRLSFIQLSV